MHATRAPLRTIKPDLVIPAHEDLGRPYPYRPLHAGVLLERIVAARSKGGIVIPDKTRFVRERTINQAVLARVLAVGRGRQTTDGTLRPVDVAPGDVVLTFTFSGRGVTNWGDEDRFLCHEDDIIALVDDPDQIDLPAVPFAR